MAVWKPYNRVRLICIAPIHPRPLHTDTNKNWISIDTSFFRSIHYQKIYFIFHHPHHTIKVSKLKEAVFMRNKAMVTVHSYKGGIPF